VESRVAPGFPGKWNHLRVLREAIVADEPAGRFTYYRLRPEVLVGLSEAVC